MEREVISNAGMEHFAEIGLIIFVIVFALIILRVVFMNKEYSTKMGHLPLDEDSDGPSTQRSQEVQT